MPYIPKSARQELQERKAGSEGELNYLITNLVVDWLTREGYSPHYADFNAAIGVLESVKLELYRRMLAPYEEQMKERNGDVFPQEPVR